MKHARKLAAMCEWAKKTSSEDIQIAEELTGADAPIPNSPGRPLSSSHNKPLVDVTSREICKLCYHVNTVGFRVPDRIWRAIVPEVAQESVVCLACFTRLGDENTVQWDTVIKFYPVSLATHLDPAPQLTKR